MRMFNADGSESEMCGNGVRCVAKYSFDHGLTKNNPMKVETGRGVLTLDGQTNPISMTLHANGGRGAMPIVEGLLSEASKQILLIHVGGTLEHPESRTEPFPVANQTLQQFQADPNKPPVEQAGFMKSLFR
jgi:hypothetical protein